MHWALPLWSERGLIGILLLGDKTDAGLFTQEEFEIARSAGERMLDIQASIELSRRLFLLQRQRLSQNRLLDHQTRRILHDEVLPMLHAAMLNLDRPEEESPEQSSEAIKTLANVHRQIARLIREMPRPYIPQLAHQGFGEALQRMVAAEMPDAFAQVTWQIDPNASAKEGSLPEWALEVIYYAAREAIRNASRHAAGVNGDVKPQLEISESWKDGLAVCIRNSTVEPLPNGETGGSGQGLALYSTMIAVIGGTLSMEALPSGCAQVLIHLPDRSFQELQSVD
jgi:hypothetical protein